MPRLLRKAPLEPGEPAPWFRTRTASNPDYQFSSVAGRTIVVCFFQSMADPLSREVIEAMHARPEVFEDDNASWFGVSEDPEDERQARVADRYPGFRYFWDPERAISGLFGVNERTTYVLDIALRVVAAIPFGDDARAHAANVCAVVAAQPPVDAVTPLGAPVLVVPRVFEEALCERLRRYYDENASYDSGFMKEREGKTVRMLNHDFKRRRDCQIEDAQLREACAKGIDGKLRPQIERAFQFRATRIERQIVACYDATRGGFFRAHRDNTTKGTAHRRFAVSLFLNEDFEGGTLRFPEYGRHLYKAPLGGAVVFSCSMLHEATPVTRGRRYMYLPFLYDDEGAALRAKNSVHLADDQLRYRRS
ncbi:MAG TPA: 2OG-Fe(II) oxygenase [Burkholderiales bacterium]|nr:2OG-Fe(II) oxygenase [Burkholderiales bacterium]HEX2651467.1 2OG-Fe(II) oxygenase [Burkholderiales bacterium]